MEKKTKRYRVLENRRTAKTVVAVKLAPEDGEVFEFKAGQFTMLRLLNPDGTMWRAKAYSVCSPPSERSFIELGFKIYGPFTQRAAALAAGDLVELAGPYGVFTLEKTPKDSSVAFLAGGIGVTPFLSMTREAMVQKDERMYALLYANVTTEDIAFQDEILALTDEYPNFSATFFVEHGALPPLPAITEVGRIPLDALKKYCGDFATTDYLMCGPPPFMEAMTKYLAEQGVPKERIRKENF